VPYDSTATKKRLLDAAFAEFAERGLAGARVDAIAAAAAANKQAIYAYFGSKEGLFRAVLDEHCEAALARVPFDAEDLAGFAMSLFDHLVEDPRILRLAMWKQLELPGESPQNAFRTRALQHAQSLGTPSKQRAEDLFALVLSLTSSVFLYPPGSGSEPPSPRRISLFRASLRRSIDAVIAELIKA
jgi:AcrR family transcriptional regulator